jgi:ubiquitin-protein ligase
MDKHTKRLLKDYNDIQNTPIENIIVKIKDDNVKNIYCKFYDLDDEYKNGEYIFNIKLANDHPFSPPDFYFLTPNGRFEINKKLCFSNSSYHKEEWSPIWNLKTIIFGFYSFFLEKDTSGIGHLKLDIEKKINYAIKSKEYNIKNKLNDYFIE